MGGGAAFGGHVSGAARLHHVGDLHGYPEGWMATTKKTIEDELKFRGIEPAVISEVVSKIEEPSSVMPVLLAIAVTALLCTLIFVVIWENTP